MQGRFGHRSLTGSASDLELRRTSVTGWRTAKPCRLSCTVSMVHPQSNFRPILEQQENLKDLGFKGFDCLHLFNF